MNNTALIYDITFYQVDEDEFIGGVEIDANSKEEVWNQLKKLIKIEEVK